MALSISIGDFVATAKLISSIVSSLRRSAKAPAEYQELERELFGLEKALKEIEHLELHSTLQPAANAIKCAALNCQHVLEEFNSKLSAYAEAFSLDRPRSRLETMNRKLRWDFSMKDEVTKLRMYIAAHVGSLNIRLLTLGLESTTVLSGHVQDMQTEQERTVSCLQQWPSDMQKQQAAQTATLSKVLDILSSVLEPQVQSLFELTQRVWTSNIQSTQMLEHVASHGLAPDLHHTWLQEPVRLEDPFRRHITIPSEYSFDMMEAVILARCKSDPGAWRIREKHFEISNSRNSDQSITRDRFTSFIPGMSLRMAVLLYDVEAHTDRCPVPTCRSPDLRECMGGGKLCNLCNVWFSPGSRKQRPPRQTFYPPTETYEQRPLKRRRRKFSTSDQSLDFSGSHGDDSSLFKNIRLGQTDQDTLWRYELAVLCYEFLPRDRSEPSDVFDTRIFLGNLPANITKEEIKDHFSRHVSCTINEIQLFASRGFVKLTDPMDGREVVPALHGSNFQGHRLIVQFAKGFRPNRVPQDYQLVEVQDPCPLDQAIVYFKVFKSCSLKKESEVAE